VEFAAYVRPVAIVALQRKWLAVSAQGKRMPLPADNFLLRLLHVERLAFGLLEALKCLDLKAFQLLLLLSEFVDLLDVLFLLVLKLVQLVTLPV